VLYLIGGAARSGKSLLARRLLREREIPFFSTDYLASGLEEGAPDLGVRHALPNRVRGERMWPVLAGVLRNLAEVEPAYVVEGDVLLPADAARFALAHEGRARACFLGYAHCDPGARRAALRRGAGDVNDWVAGMTDGELDALVAEMREFSVFLESECRAHRVLYFDGSTDFDGALDRARAYLLDDGQARNGTAR